MESENPPDEIVLASNIIKTAMDSLNEIGVVWLLNGQEYYKYTPSFKIIERANPALKIPMVGSYYMIQNQSELNGYYIEVLIVNESLQLVEGYYYGSQATFSGRRLTVLIQDLVIP